MLNTDLRTDVDSDNGPEITKALKAVLKQSYNFDSTVSHMMTTHGFYTERISAKPSFYALYRSFTQCIFVENEGDIVFYKNKQGEAQRHCGQED